MAIPTFNATENYDSFRILTEAQLNALASSIETQFNTYTTPNLEQIGLDVFGDTYELNNDGVATYPTPLIDLVALLDDDETITGSWEFSGTTTFSAAVSSSSTFTSTGQMKARVYLSGANQTINTATETAISFNAESFDTGTMHDNSTNPSRITIPTGGSGSYSFVGQVTFDNSATGRREIYIYKNGSKKATVKFFSPDGTEDTTFQIAYVDDANANDYYELYVYQNSGGGLAVVLGETSTFFSALKMW